MLQYNYMFKYKDKNIQNSKDLLGESLRYRFEICNCCWKLVSILFKKCFVLYGCENILGVWLKGVISILFLPHSSIRPNPRISEGTWPVLYCYIGGSLFRMDLITTKQLPCWQTHSSLCPVERTAHINNCQFNGVNVSPILEQNWNKIGTNCNNL